MVENKELFIVNPDKPMKFTVVNNHTMLNIKKNQLSKKIVDHGGIEVPYDIRDDECIVLAQKFNDESMDENIFHIKYVRDCILKNKILDLQDYRLKNNRNTSAITNNEYIGECAFAKKILSNKSIPTQNRTTEEDLRMIEQLESTL